MINSYEDIQLVQRINGKLVINPDSDSLGVPDDEANSFYLWCMKWEEENSPIQEATIFPTLTPKQIKDNSLANITWTRLSDGAEVQIRHPDYAADYLLMEKAKDRLLAGESRNWIDKHDNPITLTKEDMEECLAYGDEQIESIYEEYIATL